MLQRRQLTTGATPETMLSIEAVDPAVTARRAQILEEVKRMDEKRGEQVRLSCGPFPSFLPSPTRYRPGH